MIIQSVDQVIGTRPLPHIAPDATVRDACYELDRLNVGALAVIDGDALVGVVSERDVIRKCVCAGRPTGVTRVSAIMTRDPVVVGSNETLTEALLQMIDGGFRHLPVVRGGSVIGLLSIRDIPSEYRLMLERGTDQAEPRLRA